MGGHGTSVLGHGIRADPKSFLVGQAKGQMKDGLGNKPAYKSI